MFNTLYIFNREGNCCFYKEWNRKKPSTNLEEEFKLMYGFIFQLKLFCAKTSVESTDGGFHFYKTSAYKLHFYESASMVKFILLTDPNVGDMRELLKKFFEYYTTYVVKNPMYELNSKIDNCTLFIEHLDQEVKNWRMPSR
mmetsp:Transcript_875/g.1103  ORF Transcript_875/g.1103 Transcript_875/m.1103 type:complete len:141 (-) Transcript_875:3368-3790(-)